MNPMRKLIILAVAAVTAAAVLSLSASAKSGDIAGDYYYTDIVTYIYHAPVTTYNIRAQAVIDAEILNWHYGFDVYWHADKRWLEITDKGGTFNSLQALSGELCDTGVKDSKIGSYFQTDIVTTVNGVEVGSYNIGGKTCIVVTDLRKAGYTVTWDAAARTMKVTKSMGFYTFDTDFGLVKTQNNYECKDASFMAYDRGLRLYDTENNAFELPLPSGRVLADVYGVSYIRLSDLCAVTGAECTMTHEWKHSNTDWGNGISYTEEYYEHGFALTYDGGASPAVSPAVTPAVTPAGGDVPPVKFEIPADAKCYKISDFKNTVNGAENGFTLLMGGREYPADIYIIDGVVYVPAYMAAKLLGYFNAN